VIIGVAGEGVEIVLKIMQHKLTNENFLAWCKLQEFAIEIWGAVFWIIVVIGLAVEFRYGHKAKTITDAENVRLIQNAAELRQRAANTESNLVVLNKATLELAHQYDLSTNALAEANARLAAIRPLKDRLIDCLNLIDPSILPALRGGKTKFQLTIPMYKSNLLIAIVAERGSAKYISVNLAAEIFLMGPEGGEHQAKMTIELDPALAQ